MCGIAGYISLNNCVKKEQLEQGAMLMYHRGPDAGGTYFSEDRKIGLAHRRLSILDLSAAANQPMFSANGRYCIVFNGEIYNFRELALQLKDKGASLKTTSDTEVILELFAQQGPSCFAGMNGMFAFAILDIQQQELTLCRDHAGIKPLFVYQDDQTIIFASELKVIKSIQGEKLGINRTAIPYFLHLGFIPQPLTIFSNTSKFPPAHYIQVRLKRLSFAEPLQPVAFWKLEDTVIPETECNEAFAKVQLNDLLFDAVEKQLISDVPIGTFLSGGTDSSLITAIASKVVGSRSMRTFSMAIDSGKFNESMYAERVAKLLNTDHYSFKVTEKEVIELVDKLMPAYDEPFADSSAFPTMMVSRLARKHVTVALSGDGGDELFQGYGMYKWAKRLSVPGMQLVKDPLYYASKLMSSRYQRIGNMFAYDDKESKITHIFSQEQYCFMEQEIEQLLVNPAFDFKSINSLPFVARKFSEAERQSFWDFTHYLPDDLLVKMDRASMQYSLETRVPLLDYRLAAFAFNLDESLKVKNGSMKYLLKQVLFDHIPREIFDRPKWGFSIPLAKWLKTDLRYLLDKYTAPAIIEKYSVVSYPAVALLKQQYLKGNDYLFNRLWLIIVLHWWLEHNSTQQTGTING